MPQDATSLTEYTCDALIAKDNHLIESSFTSSFTNNTASDANNELHSENDLIAQKDLESSEDDRRTTSLGLNFDVMLKISYENFMLDEA